MNEKIKVMIVDDQTVLAEGIRSVLLMDEGIDVIALATDGADALEKIKKNPPDVVLMDIRMPNMNGVVATKHIKTLYPDIKVVVLTTFDDSDYILHAINYGASGYLLKDIGGEALVKAVKNAYDGDMILPAQIVRKIADVAKDMTSDREIKLKKKFPLADREVEIALMMYEGFTNRQISSALKISEGTVRNYISSLYEKTGTGNRINFMQMLEEIL